MGSRGSAPQWHTQDGAPAELKARFDVSEEIMVDALERRLLAPPRRGGAALRAGLASSLALSLLVAGAAVATNPPGPDEKTPRQRPYRGVLDKNGVPVPAGSLPMTFEIFDAAQSGNLLWDDSMSVAVQDGKFTVALGDSPQKPIPASAFGQPNLYLQVTVNGLLLSGRQRLLSVPYTIQAANAHNATNVTGGTVKAASVSAESVRTGSLAVGGNARIDPAGALAATSLEVSGKAFSMSTSSADPGATLTSKSYVDSGVASALAHGDAISGDASGGITLDSRLQWSARSLFQLPNKVTVVQMWVWGNPGGVPMRQPFAILPPGYRPRQDTWVPATFTLCGVGTQLWLFRTDGAVLSHEGGGLVNGCNYVSQGLCGSMRRSMTNRKRGVVV
jgi:hypothetical protein